MKQLGFAIAPPILRKHAVGWVKWNGTPQIGKKWVSCWMRSRI